MVLAVITVITITSCRKATDNPAVLPPAPVNQLPYLQLTASGVQQSGSQLYALVSINNEAGQEIVSNKKVTLDNVQGTYKTDKISLPKGSFVLAKFIVVNNKDTAVYAAPKSNSEKALLVSTPVSVPVTISQTGVHAASVQVLKITETDSPASYGYSADDFGLTAFADVSVKLMIAVGQTVYDSLPGKLMVDATSSTGTHWIREIELQQGITRVRVPKNYESFKFEVSKWDIHVQKILSRTDLATNGTIELNGTRLPKLLVEETVFMEDANGLVPDSRTEYYYTAQNRLSNIRFYQKSIQVSGLQLTSLYQFLYSNGQLDTIKRSASDNTLNGYTSFTYANGRIASARNSSYDQLTTSIFDYSQSGTKNIITADYLFNNGNTMSYAMQFSNGNLISDNAQSSRGGGEAGVYTYDSNINPKHQLGYPDIFLSNASKNNLTSEQKSYAGGFPTAVPYKFEYIYNADGYPEEAYISYKGYISQQHLYRIKKVYKYQ